MRVGHPVISVTIVKIQGWIIVQNLIKRPYFFLHNFLQQKVWPEHKYCTVAKLTVPENCLNSVSIES